MQNSMWGQYGCNLYSVDVQEGSRESGGGGELCQPQGGRYGGHRHQPSQLQLFQ